MLKDLNYDEICILIEAVDAWKNRSFAGEMMGELFGAMFSDKLSPEKKAEMEKEKLQKKKELEIKKQKEETKATLLKAKLMTIRDSMVNEVTRALN